MSKKLHVAVLLPTRDLVHTGFAFSLYAMLGRRRSQGDGGAVVFDISVHNGRNSNLAGNRNYLVERGCLAGASHLLFLDSDMIFPPETAATLLADSLRLDANIVSGTYSKHGEGAVVHDASYVPGDGIHEVVVAGTSVMMIGAEVFMQLPRPWFMFGWSDTKSRSVHEDEYFCSKARRAGFKIAVDRGLSCRIRHIETCAYPVYEAADLSATRSRPNDVHRTSDA